MILENVTKQTIITGNLKEATSFSDRVLGLLNPVNPRSLLFRTRFGIHTFGLKEPIDVLVLDSTRKVVKDRAGLKPNRLFFWNPLFPIVIELSVNAIKSSRTEIGDNISLKN